MMSTEAEVASTPSEVASPKEEEEEKHKVSFIVEEEEKQNDDSPTFLEAVMTQQAEAEEAPDIENQQQERPPLLPATNHSIGILASHKSHRINNTINDDNDDDGKEHEQNDDGNSSTDSVFSFDSYELKGIPLNFQSVIHPQTSTTVARASTTAPFPSIVAASIEHSSNNALPISHNTCPCHCLFFTVKESICLVMSALGCAVFFAGLVVLCLYLEGTLFAERETA